MSEGGKPGITVKVEVLSVLSNGIVLKLDSKDVVYFKAGQEFIVQFMPVEEKKDGE